MTQEEKQLLLVDLCARLPYGVTVNVYNGKFREDKKLWSGLFDSNDLWDAKPYLRPMSSMTEKERNFFQRYAWLAVFTHSILLIDWLNEHMLDYRGLIPQGLALKALKGMYKFEEEEEL